VGDSNEFKGAGTRNVEAYELFLKGSSLMFLDRPAAQRLLDQAISLDPEYAAAWAVRGISTAANMWDALPQDAPALLDQGFGYIQRAVELDPDSWQVLIQYGTVLWGRADWIAAHQTYLKALGMREDRLLYNQYANMLVRTGRLQEARIQYDNAEAVEPLDGRPADLRSLLSLAQGRFEEAHAIHYWRPQSDQNAPPVPKANWAIALISGNREDLQASLPNRRSESGSAELLFLPVAENVYSPEVALEIIRKVYADESAQWSTKLDDIAQFAAFFGDAELALEAKSREARLTVVRLHTIWYPVMKEVRSLPGFKQLVQELGLVDYWHKYGWADYCRPLGGEDFTCANAAP
jgi:tetratricopeptide (TPR) repeat protein